VPLNQSLPSASPDAGFLELRRSSRSILQVASALLRIFNVHRFRKHDSAKNAMAKTTRI
jgi:hypothetical protein